MNPRTALRAVIFDIGGVLTESPVTHIRAYIREHGIPEEARSEIFIPREGPWARFERSELSADDFAREFERIIATYGVAADGRHFLEYFSQGTKPRPEMIEMVKALREHARLGVITNNVARPAQRGHRKPEFDIHDLFEVVIESSLVGARKPEPRIYQMCCDALGVAPHEAAFLDDLGENLKGARALGMHTIKVDETLSAIAELEAALGIKLPHSPGARRQP